MRFALIGVFVLLLTACVRPNTVEDLLTNGRQVPVLYSDLPMYELDSKIESFIRKCYRPTYVRIYDAETRYIKMIDPINRPTIGYSKIELPNGIQHVVDQFVTDGTNHFLSIALTTMEDKDQIKLTAVAGNIVIAQVHDELELIAQGNSTSCPIL